MNTTRPELPPMTDLQVVQITQRIIANDTAEVLPLFGLHEVAYQMEVRRDIRRQQDVLAVGQIRGADTAAAFFRQLADRLQALHEARIVKTPGGRHDLHR